MTITDIIASWRHIAFFKVIKSNKQILLIAFITVLLLLISFVLIFLLVFPPEAIVHEPTPYVNIIPAPSESATIDISKIITTPTTKPLVVINGISIGSYVQIFGTENTGLRLRERPGLQTNIVFIASESEVLEVLDGPMDVDGKTWWFLAAPYDPNRKGWAVNNYLIPINTPVP